MLLLSQQIMDMLKHRPPGGQGLAGPVGPPGQPGKDGNKGPTGDAGKTLPLQRKNHYLNWATQGPTGRTANPAPRDQTVSMELMEVMDLQVRRVPLETMGPKERLEFQVCLGTSSEFFAHLTSIFGRSRGSQRYFRASRPYRRSGCTGHSGRHRPTGILERCTCDTSRNERRLLPPVANSRLRAVRSVLAVRRGTCTARREATRPHLAF